MLSTLGDIIEYTGGYHEYTGELGTVGDSMSTPGNIISTVGVSSVHQGCSVRQGYTMSTLGDTIMIVVGYHEYMQVQGFPQ